MQVWCLDEPANLKSITLYLHGPSLSHKLFMTRKAMRTQLKPLMEMARRLFALSLAGFIGRIWQAQNSECFALDPVPATTPVCPSRAHVQRSSLFPILREPCWAQNFDEDGHLSSLERAFQCSRGLFLAGSYCEWVEEEICC